MAFMTTNTDNDDDIFSIKPFYLQHFQNITDLQRGRMAVVAHEAT